VAVENSHLLWKAFLRVFGELRVKGFGYGDLRANCVELILPGDFQLISGKLWLQLSAWWVFLNVPRGTFWEF
jgi:hypothetical protein